MDAQVRRTLAEFLRREGVGLAESPHRVKALLMDTCPQARMEVGVLEAAAQEDIPGRLIRSSDSVMRDGEIARSISDLRQSRGFDPQAAAWSVRSWAWALGVVPEEPDDVPAGVSPVAQAGATGVAPQRVPQQSVPAPPATPRSPASASPGVSGPPVSTPSVPGPAGRPFGSPPSGSLSEGPSGPPGSAPTSNPPPAVTPGPGNPQWPSQVPPWASPAVPGTPPGTSPPVSSAPKPNQKRVIAIAGAVLAVLALFAFLAWPDPVLPPPVSDPTPSSTPAETAAAVDFTITEQLDTSWKVAEVVTVYWAGRNLGSLEVDLDDPTATLPLTADAPGTYGYRLDVWVAFVATDGSVQEINLGGSGEIQVAEGDVFRVELVPDGDSYAVTLNAL